MAQMIEVTKKVYNNGDDLINEKFMINADNINYIESITDHENWENSIIFMNDKTTIYTVETKFEIQNLVNNKYF